MKYSTTTNNPEAFNKYEISEYIESLDAYVVTLNETEAAEVFEYVNKNSGMDSLPLHGEDHLLYKINSDGIVLVTKYDKVSFTAEEYVKHFRKVRETVGKDEKIMRKKVASADKDMSRKKFSVLPFESYEYISKTHNLSFSYRVRKSRTPDSPVWIYFHGGGGEGRDNVKQLVGFLKKGKTRMKKAKGTDCTVILPQCGKALLTGSEKICDYLSAVKELSEAVAKEVKADTDRIYIAGGSFGGHCTWQSAYMFPDYYACAIPVMGAFGHFEKDKSPDMSRFMDIPLWVAHSEDDTTVPIDEDDKCVEILTEMGKDNLKYTRVNGYAHHYMVEYFYKNEPWAEWMFAQSNKNRRRNENG